MAVRLTCKPLLKHVLLLCGDSDTYIAMPNRNPAPCADQLIVLLSVTPQCISRVNCAKITVLDNGTHHPLCILLSFFGVARCGSTQKRMNGAVECKCNVLTSLLFTHYMGYAMQFVIRNAKLCQRQYNQ